MEKDLIDLVAQALFEQWGGAGKVSSLKSRNKKPWLDTGKAIIEAITKYYVIAENDINYFDGGSKVEATIILRGGTIRCIYLNDYRVFGSKPIPGETYVIFNGKVGDVVCAIPELNRILNGKRLSGVK